MQRADLIPAIRWYDNFAEICVGRKFIDGLQANSTGVAVVCGDYRDGVDFVVAAHHHRADCCPLGANRGPVRSVFNIRSDVNVARFG